VTEFTHSGAPNLGSHAHQNGCCPSNSFYGSEAEPVTVTLEGIMKARQILASLGLTFSATCADADLRPAIEFTPTLLDSMNSPICTFVGNAGARCLISGGHFADDFSVNATTPAAQDTRRDHPERPDHPDHPGQSVEGRTPGARNREFGASCARNTRPNHEAKENRRLHWDPEPIERSQIVKRALWTAAR